MSVNCTVTTKLNPGTTDINAVLITPLVVLLSVTERKDKTCSIVQ